MSYYVSEWIEPNIDEDEGEYVCGICMELLQNNPAEAQINADGISWFELSEYVGHCVNCGEFDLEPRYLFG